jgi:hypothetical protein
LKRQLILQKRNDSGVEKLSFSKFEAKIRKSKRNLPQRMV